MMTSRHERRLKTGELESQPEDYQPGDSQVTNRRRSIEDRLEQRRIDRYFDL